MVRLIISAPISSIRIVIHWRRPRLTIDASGDARADVCLTRRPGNRPRLTGRPRTADARTPMDMFFMLRCMPAAARLGLGWCDPRNHHQRRRVYGQCQKPDRNFAHASLLKAPLMVHCVGPEKPAHALFFLRRLPCPRAVHAERTRLASFALPSSVHLAQLVASSLRRRAISLR